MCIRDSVAGVLREQPAEIIPGLRLVHDLRDPVAVHQALQIELDVGIPHPADAEPVDVLGTPL